MSYGAEDKPSEQPDSSRNEIMFEFSCTHSRRIALNIKHFNFFLLISSHFNINNDIITFYYGSQAAKDMWTD